MKKASGKKTKEGAAAFQEEEYLSALYEEMGRGFIILDSRDRIVAANGACARTLGIPDSALRKRSLSSLTASRSRKMHSRHRIELRKTGKAQHYEGEMIRGDGTPVPVMFIRYRLLCNRQKEYLVIHDVSLKMAMMREMNLFRDKCEQVFENSLDGMFILSQDGIIRACNASFEKIFGASRDALIGRSYKQFVRQENIAKIERNLKKRLKGDLQLVEYQTHRIDGTEIRVEVMTHATRNPDGLTEFFGYVRDISERHALYNRLMQSEETHKTLVENAEEMMFILSHPGGAIEYFNPKCSEHLDIQKENSPALVDFIHPDDRDYYNESVARLEKAPRKSIEYSFRILTRNMGLRHVSANSVLLSSLSRNPRVISVLRDITEQKYLANRLKSSEERLRNLFDHANDLIIIFDKNGRILDCNRKAEKMTGYSRAELLAMTFGNLHYEQASSVESASDPDGIFPAKPDLPVDIELARKDGTVFPIEFMLTRMYDDEKNFVAYLSVSRDISERKRLRDQLLQAEKLSSLGELISGVAHELNNPLSVVLGCSELIGKSKDLPAHLLTKSNLIINGATRCAKIIENMISFARKKELYKEYVDVHEILDRALELHTYQFKISNVTVEREYTGEPVFTMADPFQLQQVFLNLVNNSSDAIRETSRQGQILIRTSVDMGHIRIEIVDNGSGIPASIQNRIFDPFFTTKEVGKGTGLGLSVSYGIVKEHQGDLFLDRSFRRGAKFVVLLPVLKSESEKHSDESIKQRTDAKKGARILVVDADEAILQMCEEILLDSGYIVDTSFEGTHALSLIKATRYDGILLDILIEGKISGKDLLYQLKALDPDYHQKVVLITIESAHPEFKRFIDEQNLPYISKPFHTRELLDTLLAITL